MRLGVNSMYTWVKREGGLLIGLLPVLFVLVVIAVELYRIDQHAAEANRHSAENNAILKGRKPCLMETGR